MQKTILQSVESARNQKGKMSGVAYDTAWVARIISRSGKPLFPECSRWLLENQHPDGSWGSRLLNYHDRIISTLSAITALKELYGTRYEYSIEKGETFVWQNIKNLEEDDYRLIGSELLFPSLLEQAESLGLNVPSHMKVYKEEQNTKLKKIDESLWYSPLTTLSFSIEFLGDAVDVSRLPYAQLQNGSIANSPAATAYFLRHVKNTKAIAYLKEILSLTGDGSVMTVYPIDVFEYGWTLYNLMLAGHYFERYIEICNFLFHQLKRSGIGCTSESPVADADDTAVVLKVLHDMGYSIDANVLDEYYTGDYFLTFNFELDPSISTNIHVLDFIKSYSMFPERQEVIEKLVKFLKAEMNEKGFWVDKWHVSPYYPTSHAVLALCETDPSLAERAVDWIIESQNENGMWGGDGGTLEETSYAVQALMYFHQHVERIDSQEISRAVSALSVEGSALLSSNSAELWIGKVLYAPSRVVWSSITGAQLMARAHNLRATT
jgi:halimadienyl-diphosphate synthase